MQPLVMLCLSRQKLTAFATLQCKNILYTQQSSSASGTEYSVFIGNTMIVLVLKLINGISLKLASVSF